MRKSITSASSFEEHKEFWLHAIFYLLVLQGSILAFAWAGLTDNAHIRPDLKNAQIEYFKSQGIPFDENGNPTNIGELTPAQLSVKDYYDKYIQDVGEDNRDGLFFAAFLLMGLVNIAFTTILGGLFLKNLRSHAEWRVRKMKRYIGVSGFFTAICIFFGVSLTILSLFHDMRELIGTLMLIVLVLAGVAFIYVELKSDLDSDNLLMEA